MFSKFKISVFQIVLLLLTLCFTFLYFSKKIEIAKEKQNLNLTKGIIEYVYWPISNYDGNGSGKNAVIEYVDSINNNIKFISEVNDLYNIGDSINVYYNKSITKTFIGQSERQGSTIFLALIIVCFINFFLLISKNKLKVNRWAPFVIFGLFILISFILTYYFMVILPEKENNLRNRQCEGEIVEIVSNKRLTPYSIVKFYHEELDLNVFFSSNYLNKTNSKVEIHYHSNSGKGAIIKKDVLTFKIASPFIIFILTIVLLLIKNYTKLGYLLSEKRIL